MSLKSLSGAVLISMCGLCMSAFATVETVDFINDQPETYSAWSLGKTDQDENHGRKFPNGGESITSPVYGGAAVSISVSARMFSTGNGSALMIKGRTDETEDWKDLHNLVFANNSITNETVVLARVDNYRQFQLTFIKGVGTLRVGSFTVKWMADGEMAVPSELSADSVDADSFVASWTIDEAVDSFLVDCWKESMTQWTGTTKWSETFENCTNATKSLKLLTAEKIDRYTDHEGWGGDFVYAPKMSEGVIQINKESESIGWLVSPPLQTGNPVELLVRARAGTEQNDNVMPVFLIRNGSTNELASFHLTTSFDDYHCGLPDITEGDRLAFKSFSVGSHRSVLIDSISLVEGFEPGHPETTYVFESKSVTYSENPHLAIEGLIPECTYAFSVRAVSGGAISEQSAACRIVTASIDGAEDDGDELSVAASKITHTSFRLDWPSVSGAASYRVSVWTNIIEGVSSGTTSWRESFSKAEASGSTTAIKPEKFYDEYADNEGWLIVSNAYPSVDTETVRLGNTSNPGELMMPTVQIPEGATLHVRARRFQDSVGAIFSAWKLSGNELTAIGEPRELDVQMTDCYWPLPTMTSNDRIVLRSSMGKSGDYRTIFDEVEILEGYSQGKTVPDYAVNAEESTQLFYSVAELPSAIWMYTVEAVDEAGNVIAAVTDNVDLVNPPPRPVIDAVALSEMKHEGKDRIWSEDFSSFSNVFPKGKNTVDWLNGTTLAHWQAYCGSEPVTVLKRNSGANKQTGLYAYWTADEVEDSYSLGTMMSAQADQYVYGLSFVNDTAFSVRKIAVGFDGMQFGFNNNEVQNMFCEYLVTNELASVAVDGDWRICDSLTYRTTKDSKSGLTSGVDMPVATALSAEIPDINVPAGSYFMIRWRRNAVSNSAAMAIDNVTVSFEVQPRPMTIVIR